MVQFLCVLDNVCISYILLAIAGQALEAQPTFGLCVTQAALIYAGSSSVSDLFATGVHALNLLQDGLYNILIGFLCERCPWQ